MKINKLFFLLLVLIGFNSCVDFVNHELPPDDIVIPEDKTFTAIHSNPTEAKYVDDEFTFKAELDNVDVTASTNFKVNGVDIQGNMYVPDAKGVYSVIATMDNYAATFKFDVLEKEDPEPLKNRIEYGGKSYPVTTTFWLLDGDSKTESAFPEDVEINGKTVKCTKWVMVSMDNTDISKATAVYYNVVYIPLRPDNFVGFPYETSVHLISGNVLVNKTDLVMKEVTYVFNAATDMNVADFTSTMISDNAKTAKLIWEGNYTWGFADLSQAKGGKVDMNMLGNIVENNHKKKNVKIVKR